MPNIVARLSGLVAYNDGSKGQFAATLDDQGRVSYNQGSTIPAPTDLVPFPEGTTSGIGNVDSAENMAEVNYSTATWLSSSTGLFSLLPSTSFNPQPGSGALPAGWVTQHATGVAAMNLDFAGRVTLDVPVQGSPTWEDFHVLFLSWPQNNGTILGAFVDYELNPDGGDVKVIGASGSSPWTKIVSSTTLVAALNTMLNPLGVSVTAVTRVDLAMNHVGTPYRGYPSTNTSIGRNVPVGTSITFTATITPPTSVTGAAGTVQFKNGSTNLGAAVTMVNGQATYNTTALAAGTHAITAVFTYTGGMGFPSGPFTSNAVNLTSY